MSLPRGNVVRTMICVYTARHKGDEGIHGVPRDESRERRECVGWNPWRFRTCEGWVRPAGNAVRGPECRSGPRADCES